MDGPETTQQSAGSFLDQLYDKTIAELSETVEKIKINIDQLLQQYMKAYKQGLRDQINFLQTQKDDELIESFIKLKEQIKNNRSSLFQYTQGLNFELSLKFGFTKVPASPLKQIEEIESVEQIESIQEEENQAQDEPKYMQYNFSKSSKQISRQRHRERIQELLRKRKIVPKNQQSKKRKRINLRCPDCNKSFQENRNKFLIHLSTFHNKTLKYQCPQCTYIDFDYRKLARHLLANHKTDSNGQMTLICPFTQKKFINVLKLSNHIRDNHEYKCFYDIIL